MPQLHIKNQTPSNSYQAPATGQQAPSHVAIIMDGNGRWAAKRKAPRVKGHQQGAEALRNTLKACKDMNIKWLTVYAFSSENWNRPEQEIADLMGLLKHYLNKEINALHNEGIKLTIIGDRSKLSSDIQKMLKDAEAKTAQNNKFHLNVALSYGSKQELTQAFQTIATHIQQGLLTPEQINEQLVADNLYTAGIPEPDLLIRTGGEQRLSNFLLWQMAYTELYFTDTLWPDFSEDDMKQAVEAYSKRERRYGNTHT